jgi:rare lipoprotein A
MKCRNFFLIIIFFTVSKLAGQTDSFPSTGKASFYHDKFQGRETSNGEEYNQNDFTAAHKTLPFNTIVHVTNKQNNRSVVVRINDRGPFKKSRIIDLTRAAAKKLDMIPFGVVPVKIKPLTFLDRANLSDSLIHENEVWDCFSNRTELQDSTIYIWQTASIKHAFYMASDLLLSYHLSNVYVKAIKSGEERKYMILVPLGITPEATNAFVKILKQEGFLKAKVVL